MSALEDILRHKPQEQKTIAMSEGEDPRIVEGALKAIDAGLARIILVGEQAKVEAELDKLSAKPSDDLVIHDPKISKHTAEFAQCFFELRKHKGITVEQASQSVLDPMFYAAMLVRNGIAHGTIGGAVHTTSDTVRAALQVIGPKKGTKTVSSFFLMADADETAERPILVFSDCGLIIDPTAEELAAIAIASASSFQGLTGTAPKVAMLSFSSHGSAKHVKVDKIVQGLALAKEQAPDLSIGGELQFDAAFVPSVGAKKAPDDPVAGQANVFVFPDLDAGNIGYKIAQRIGKMRAVGPVLQGLAMPANDLSRGCSADDVVDMIGVTVRQASQV